MDILGFCILRRCGALGCTAAVIALSDAGRQSTAVGLQATSLRRLRVRMRYKLESHFDLDLVANPERRFAILDQVRVSDLNLGSGSRSQIRLQIQVLHWGAGCAIRVDLS